MMKFWRKIRGSQPQPEVAGGDDYNAKMTRAEALPESLAREETREAALADAVMLASDDDYYVAEKAVDALVLCGDPSHPFMATFATGSDQARALVLQATGRLAEKRPDAVSGDLIQAAAKLLQARDSVTRFVATRTLLSVAESLPGQSASIRAHLEESLQSAYSGIADRFADKLFVPSDVAGHLVDLCTSIPEAIDLVVTSLSDDRPIVREGAARTIARLGKLANSAVEILDNRITNESNWSARIWAAAAWEAVRDRALPDDRWPVARGEVWQMVFFESENADVVPAGVRFDANRPLRGVLKREYGALYLDWPDNHGVTSSDRLLDDYGPILVRGFTGDLSEHFGQAVEVTGMYRDHKIFAETIDARRRGSKEAT